MDKGYFYFKMRSILKLLLLLLLITPVFGQGDHIVYLIGDAGEDSIPGLALESLRKEITEHPNSTTIFLGDNIYPRGSYKENSSKGKRDNPKLVAQMSLFKNGYTGNVFFVPGNHDWKKSRPNGLTFIKRQGDFVDKYFRENSQIKNRETGSYLPKGGGLGPAIRKIEYGGGVIKLIFIDTQWYLQKTFIHKVSKPDGVSTIDYLDQQLEVLKKEVDQSDQNSEQVLVVAHHPLFTLGSHGLARPGYRILNILDLPFFGLLGTFRLVSQNLSGRRYRVLQKKLVQILDNKNVIYAAGHEHNLQYWRKGNMHQIVSGSGSKTTEYFKNAINNRWNSDASLKFPIMESKKQTSRLGYFKLVFNTGGELEIRVIEISDDGNISCKILFPSKTMCSND